MRQEFDSSRKIYRTERPKAGLFVYVLMFALAFGVGAGGGVFAGMRYGYGRGNVVAAARNDAGVPKSYADLKPWAVIGGFIAMAGLAGLLWGRDEE